MKYAKEEADARRAGDPVKLAEASKRHEDYRQQCFKADGMIIPNPRRNHAY